MPHHTHTGRGVNVRVPREVQPGEFAAYARLIEAVAERQDKRPDPEPQTRRA